MAPESPAEGEYLFTSESVTEGHPDKICDQISDGVLDAVLADDPRGRVACETLVNTGLVVVSGEISTETYVDIPKIARETIRQIGYDDPRYGFDHKACAVLTAIDEQSPDIAQGVDTGREQREGGSTDEYDAAGAGDQGMMFGYATRETKALMPMPIQVAHQLARQLAQVRKADVIGYLGPDGKTQVSVRYEHDRPVEIEKVLISTQHKEEAGLEMIRNDLWEHVVEPVLHAEYKELFTEDALLENFMVNPTGKFVIGGPVGDAGLTGRKIIVGHIWRCRPPRGRRVFGQGPVEGRPLGCLRGALRGQERGRRRARGPLRAPGRLRDRGRAPGLGDGADLRHRQGGGFGDRAADPGGVRPSASRLPRLPRPAPPDIPEDSRLRPLRPRRLRLHLGAHRPRRQAAPGRRVAGRLCRVALRPLTAAAPAAEWAGARSRAASSHRRRVRGARRRAGAMPRRPSARPARGQRRRRS